MERPKDITDKRFILIAVTVIILFHIVGLIGFSIPSLRPLFLKIVPYHLLLMMLVIIFSHTYFNPRFLFFILLIFITGYCAEWIGVHTSWLFGNYTYGSTLGLKLSGIPLIIGVNWFLLIYCTGVLMQRSRFKNIFIRLITGSLTLVLLDMLIEPVAINFDYWHWANVITVKNYICWFFLSGILLFAFEKSGFKKQSIVGPVLLIAQFVFFAALYWL
jgi:putative membrane protein